ncbi:MAG: aldehyde dehydrogenase (NADP(+)) [Verrucomicrobiales bacterium]|nr:aldehyde dehydrogenase (NADP(+)) [Verrucomicrobiales bacterium]
MNFHGHQIIGKTTSAESGETFTGIDPRDGTVLPGEFHEATNAEIDQAVNLAAESFDTFRHTSLEDRAAFLEAIADEAIAFGDEFLIRASAETGHPLPRCTAERGRAVNQARLFAKMVREGSWVDARIDKALPDQQPVPRPDIRSMMKPIGPIAVFGASNFPIAISVLGSDTISAFAAGCPVIIKAHPAHPGTCEAAALIIQNAIKKCGLPDGIFSLVHGRSARVGTELVKHPKLAAAAFTGSLNGGRALFDVANARPVPIPFYAEMGSVNPIFVLPGALEERADGIAKGFIEALTTGVGQFCTNPGLVFGIGDNSGWDTFRSTAAELATEYDPQTMLHSGIHYAFEEGVKAMQNMGGLTLKARSIREPVEQKSEAACYLFETDSEGLLDHPQLFEEVFGPVSTMVECQSPRELEAFAEQLDGSLTASIHGTEEDLETYKNVITVLERKIGRLIFNGYPVGLDVCDSIHHGGPYPATCHSHFTSIGTRCINRFVRPVCYQNWPNAALPPELQDENPIGIMRMVNGERTRSV